MSSDGIAEFRERISNSSASKILADGKPYKADYLDESSEDKQRILDYDPLEFYVLVDLFASEYGLGGSKSLTEFAFMIDNEDPEIIEGLKYAMQLRNSTDDEAESIQNDGAGRSVRKRTGNKMWGKESDMGDFLANSGIPQKEIREARERLKKGKISKEENEEFYAWLETAVTPEKLRSPDFDLKKTHARMKKYFDKTEKFVISASTIFNKK